MGKYLASVDVLVELLDLLLGGHLGVVVGGSRSKGILSHLRDSLLEGRAVNAPLRHGLDLKISIEVVKALNELVNSARVTGSVLGHAHDASTFCVLSHSARHRELGDLGGKHGIGEAMRHVELSSNRAAHTMNERDAGVTKGNTCLRAGEHHGLACSSVSRVDADLTQVAANFRQSCQRHRRRKGVAPLADVSFHRVAHGVHTSGRSELPRHAHGELIIDDSILGQVGETDAKHLFVGLRIGDDCEFGSLGASSSSGGDGKERESRGVHEARSLVVAHLALVHGERRSSFGGIHGGTASESDDGIISSLGDSYTATLNGIRSGLGYSVSEAAVLDSSILENLGDLGESARAFHKSVRDNKGSCGIGLLHQAANLGDGATAHDHATRKGHGGHLSCKVA
mmetsp:Transcript_11415/g.22390  ORF Transcript_11415/g.22390 Transcript_11415/m.22390 type:complete len:398 (+) Transcript_11415:294-1487(+)